MKMIIPLLSACVLLAGAAFAGGDPYVADTGPGPDAYQDGHVGMYDRIVARYAHYGRDVREEFRDGPCKVKRHWERDGDFEEHVECRGPRH
jgi:hypothetical protein